MNTSYFSKKDISPRREKGDRKRVALLRQSGGREIPED